MNSSEKPIELSAIELPVLLAGDGCLVGITEPGGGFDQGLQHRLQIEGRPADDLEHVSRGRLLLQGFTQFGSALFDLLLQVGIGFLQPRAHVVELVGKPFQFVAGP